MNKENFLKRFILGVTSLTIGSIALQVNAGEPFADDFNSDFATINYRVESEQIAEPDLTPTVLEGDITLTVLDSDPADDESASYLIQPNGTLESLKAVVAIDSERPLTGRLDMSLSGRFFNSVVDGGPAQFDDSLDRRTDDINIFVAARLFSDASEDRFEYCVERRTSDGGWAPAVAGADDCVALQTVPVLGQSYELSIGIDKANELIFISVDDEQIMMQSATPMFDVASPYYELKSRVRSGAESGVFRVSNLETNLGSVDLSTINDLGRYKTDNFDNFDDDSTRAKIVENGKLRLSASNDSRETENDAFLRLGEDSDYIEAELVYSSSSNVDTSTAGFAAVRIAGLLYREQELVDDNTGSVWGAVMLIDNAEVEGLVGEYCLIRSDSSDFSESTDLADMMEDDRCPTFDLPVVVDTPYTAKLALDREAKTVSFTLGNETKVYDIQTDIFTNDSPLRAQARIARGATGTVVGEFDNLRNDANALTDEEISAAAQIDDSGSGGGSGGGGFSALMLCLMAVLYFRRKQSIVTE